MNIDPLAAIHPTARLGQNVKIGPFCVVEANVILGQNCTLESRVVIKQGAILGDNNHLFEGAVIGGTGQHVRAPLKSGGVVIGSGNVLRENVTIHRALEAGNATTLGNNNLMMVSTHLAHDCHVGNHCIMANNAMLAGHVKVEDRAFLSGAVAAHQFCRIGQMAMLGGQARIIKDVPPFVTIDGGSGFVVGLNTIGLRRNGLSTAEITELKAAYRVIYRSRLKWHEIIDQLATHHRHGIAGHFYEFLIESHRGIAQERRAPPGATIKLRDEALPAEATTLRAKAG